MHTYWFKRAFRIMLADGLNCSKAVATSSAGHAVGKRTAASAHFHGFWCPEGASICLLTRAARRQVLNFADSLLSNARKHVVREPVISHSGEGLGLPIS